MTRISLIDAVLDNDIRAVRELLRLGENANEKDVYEQSMLMRAADKGHTEIARLLLENGADIDATDEDSRTALMHACRWAHIGIVRLLVDKGANIDLRNEMGETAQAMAARLGNDWQMRASERELWREIALFLKEAQELPLRRAEAEAQTAARAAADAHTTAAERQKRLKERAAGRKAQP